jgi:hypothetical protein
MLRQFEAERAPSIAIVMSAARRPDYGDMTLTFAIALGEVLKPNATGSTVFMT